MLLTVTGRRTGRRYTIPVGYRRDGALPDALVSKARRNAGGRKARAPATPGARLCRISRVPRPRDVGDRGADLAGHSDDAAEVPRRRVDLGDGRGRRQPCQAP